MYFLLADSEYNYGSHIQLRNILKSIYVLCIQHTVL